MSTRTPGEGVVRIRKPSNTALSSKKVVRNENVNQPTKPLAQKATLGSSTKPTAANTNVKQVLKPKTSRPVLASLTNATPRPKPASSKPTTSKPEGQTFKTPSAPALTPARKVVKTHGVAPKSTKKAISVYTPAPARRVDEHEVELAHPPSPSLQDGPPSPLKRVMEGVDDFGPMSGDVDGLDFDLPEAPTTSLDPIHSPPRHGLTSDFDFDQTDEYGL